MPRVVRIPAKLNCQWECMNSRNMHLNQLGNLLADAGYQGAESRAELADVKPEWAIAIRPGKLKELKSI